MKLFWYLVVGACGILSAGWLVFWSYVVLEAILGRPYIYYDHGLWDSLVFAGGILVVYFLIFSLFKGAGEESWGFALVVTTVLHLLVLAGLYVLPLVDMWLRRLDQRYPGVVVISVLGLISFGLFLLLLAYLDLVVRKKLLFPLAQYLVRRWQRRRQS